MCSEPMALVLGWPRYEEKYFHSGTETIAYGAVSSMLHVRYAALDLWSETFRSSTKWIILNGPPLRILFATSGGTRRITPWSYWLIFRCVHNAVTLRSEILRRRMARTTPRAQQIHSLTPRSVQIVSEPFQVALVHMHNLWNRACMWSYSVSKDILIAVEDARDS